MSVKFTKYQKNTALLVFALVFLGLNLITTERNKQGYYEVKIKTISPQKYFEANKFVNLVKDEDLPIIKPYLCIRALNKILDPIKYMICVKNVERDIISKGLVEEGKFEEEIVSIVSDCVKIYPQATFIDIGANIGLMSMAALANNNKVIAIEPMINNIAYISASAKLNRKSHLIRYFNNAISNTRMKLYGWEEKKSKNGGGTMFLTKDELAAKKTDAKDNVEISSIILEDVLGQVDTEEAIIKIDVEGYECKVLYDFLAAEDKKVYIPYIVMEWLIVLRNEGNNCPNLPQVVEAFYKSGYEPYDTFKRGPLSRDRVFKYWNNILWVHREARKIPLSDSPLDKFTIYFANNVTMVI